MDDSAVAVSWLASLYPTALPDVDDVRPKRCDRCGVTARRGGLVVIHGHGCRTRTVVILPALAEEQERSGECWERRYRCTKCRRVMVVLPKGVMPRYLYSAGAVVTAFFLVADPPIGDGLSDEQAYRRQGLNSPRFTIPVVYPYNWRSLERWAALAQEWWVCWTGLSVSSLLVCLDERSGGRGRAEAVSAALDAHVRWGCTM